MDFTFTKYYELIEALQEKAYAFITLEDYFHGTDVSDYVILRHDVDRNITNALKMASFENKLNIRATYNFRYKQFILNPGEVRKINQLGHACGYHYEEVAKQKGRLVKARNSFEKHLEMAREIVPVKTIAMHGSPLSSYDNRQLCEAYDYKRLGLLGEAYLDVDFDTVFYLTDTGRLWNDRKYNLRDHSSPASQESWKNTDGLISSINRGELPSRIMLNIHPERWNSPGLYWAIEKYGQQIRNVAKALLKPFLLKSSKG